jgi:hypothetical protein
LSKSTSHTAILIFSRTAREEAHVKQFGRHLSTAQNLRIAQLLIRRTRRMARRTRLPVFSVSGAQQRGRNFGQRFTNAISDIFGKGFERVIAIGTDCPALRPQILLAAARQLEQGKMVSGADHRGGLYYLGISRQHFHAELLAAIPWQSGRDFEVLRQYACKLEVELSAGGVLYDMDNATDLWQAFQDLLSHCPLLKQLWQLFQPLPTNFQGPSGFRSWSLPKRPRLRGPPVF